MNYSTHEHVSFSASERVKELFGHGSKFWILNIYLKPLSNCGVLWRHGGERNQSDTDSFPLRILWARPTTLELTAYNSPNPPLPGVLPDSCLWRAADRIPIKLFKYVSQSHMSSWHSITSSELRFLNDSPDQRKVTIDGAVWSNRLQPPYR